MERRRLYIFTEGGDGIGFGHLTRCSALYEKALENNFNPKFIVYGKNIDKALEKYNYEIKEWKDKKYLSTLLTKKDFVIVDSYLASLKIYKVISTLSIRALYIDDNMRLEYPEGIVVNPSLYGDKLDYPIKNNVKYLLGKDYIILRKEFEELVQRKARDEIKNILITLGGTDIRNLTPKLLKILKNINQNFKINVIIGSSFQNIKEILEEKTKNISLLYNLTASDMKKEMEKADIVISACGQTIYELLAIGVSFIPIIVADNQLNNAMGLKTLNLINYILNYSEVTNNKFHLNLLLEKKLQIKAGTQKIILELIGENCE